MEQPAKVMTVSYGTFSCRLEGFDDPFTTMQRVAEYFRELAARDRHFGSEPLQPDADYLTKIAQDTNPNTVDAERTEDGLVLRQADVVEPEAGPAPQFNSRRTPVAAGDAPQDTPDAPEDAADTDAVPHTVFSSRRSGGEAQDAAAEDADQTTSDQTSEPEQVDAPVAADEDAPASETAALDPSQGDSAALHRLPPTIQREEEALQRLLETTNSKMESPDLAEKSNTLERLRAAVAATEAERRMRGGRSDAARPVNATEFREEIAKVRKSHDTPRPKGKIATVTRLLLGQDQRVTAQDTPVEEKKSAPEPDQLAEVAKPSRVTLDDGTQPTAAAEPSEGFRDFAESSGAYNLRDLLIASAAYLSLVEQNELFSEDQIMANLSDYVSENEISEDVAKRSLTKLMMDGKILRVRQDQFTISKSAQRSFQLQMTG